jgi:hypothetical protein
LLQKHFEPHELQRFRYVPEVEWRQVEAEAQRLLRAGAAAREREVQAVLRQWLALVDRLTDGDAAIREKLQAVASREPLLADSAPISAASRAFLRRALEKKSLTLT